MFSDTKTFIKLVEVLSIIITCQAKPSWSPRQARLSSADPAKYYYHRNVDGHPNTYSYGYDVSDPATGNSQFRTEERYPNGTVVGSYGYVDPMGRARRFRYIADERGYRVMRDPPYKPPSTDYRRPPYAGSLGVTTEPSITWTRPSKNKNKIHNQNKIQSKVPNYNIQPYFKYI